MTILSGQVPRNYASLDDKNYFNSFSPSCTNCYGDGCAVTNCFIGTNWDKCPHGSMQDSTVCAWSCPRKPICRLPNTGPWCDLPSLPAAKAPFLSPVQIQCQYNLPDDTPLPSVATVAVAMRDKFGRDNKDYQRLARKVCLAPEAMTRCPSSSEASLSSDLSPEVSMCTPLQRDDVIGDLCRDWYAHLPPSDKDLVQMRWCASQDTDTPCGKKQPILSECQCVRRHLNPDYRRLRDKAQVTGNDGCWWKGCKSSTESLIPSTVSSDSCPNTCNAILEVIAGENITFQGDIHQEISCPGTSSVTKKSPNTTQPPSIVPIHTRKQKETVAALAHLLLKNRYVSIVLLAIVLVLVAYVILSKKMRGVRGN